MSLKKLRIVESRFDPVEGARLCDLYTHATSGKSLEQDYLRTKSGGLVSVTIDASGRRATISVSPNRC